MLERGGGWDQPHANFANYTNLSHDLMLISPPPPFLQRGPFHCLTSHGPSPPPSHVNMSCQVDERAHKAEELLTGP